MRILYSILYKNQSISFLLTMKQQLYLIFVIIGINICSLKKLDLFKISVYTFKILRSKGDRSRISRAKVKDQLDEYFAVARLLAPLWTVTEGEKSGSISLRTDQFFLSSATDRKKD